METSTIAAVATPPGVGGIGVVKISGPRALLVARTLFRKKRNEDLNTCSPVSVHPSSFVSHQLTHGYIVEPETHRVIDEVLLVYMKGPKTYTREDLVEIQAHSGYVVLSSILDVVLKLGVRPADPGEFTKRAFLNGRIDLAQAEAVMDLIQAKSHRALKAAAGQLQGGLTHQIESICLHLREALAWIEAGIDFPDDVEDSQEAQPIIHALQTHCLAPLSGIIEKYRESTLLRDGLKTIIAGRPNVGKSSLMNRLLEKDRAIVTPAPGTTRDIIEELFSVEGIPVVINDTAGLQETADPVESIGIQRAVECLHHSELVLFVVDGSHEISDGDQKIYREIGNLQRIIVVNKCDLLEKGEDPVLPAEWCKYPVVFTSALYNTGIGSLKRAIADVGRKGIQEISSDSIMINLRQKRAIEEGLHRLQTAIDGFASGMAHELIGIELKDALKAILSVIGQVVEIDVLDDIFSRFCIGK